MRHSCPRQHRKVGLQGGNRASFEMRRWLLEGVWYPRQLGRFLRALRNYGAVAFSPLSLILEQDQSLEKQ